MEVEGGLLVKSRRMAADKGSQRHRGGLAESVADCRSVWYGKRCYPAPRSLRNDEQGGGDRGDFKGNAHPFVGSRVRFFVLMANDHGPQVRERGCSVTVVA